MSRLPLDLTTTIKRLWNSTVVWAWVFNGVRLASGLIILPVILRVLTQADLGMYYVLLSLAALSPIVDFGFSPTIGRFASYAMGGAKSFQAQGVPDPASGALPNYPLLWNLLITTRRLYRYLTLAILVILGIWGTYLVELRIHETSSPLITRLAWAATLISTLYDIYSNWWTVYLRGLNEVRTASCIGVTGLIAKFIFSVVLLLCGAGLLSVPIATLVSCMVQRHLARVRVLSLLKGDPPASNVDLKENLRILWPNSWRLGVQFMSGYLTVNANTAICLRAFGLASNAQYGLSVQLMGIVSGMAVVWTSTKWPVIGQYQARRDQPLVQRTLWPRYWIQNLTFLLLASTVIFGVPFLLRTFGSGKQILPAIWMAVLACGSFMDLQFTTWTTLISTQNKLPFIWPTVATNVLSLALSLALVHFTSLGLAALVLGPLLAASLFNYWCWPIVACRGMETTLLRFLFLGPAKEPGGTETAPATSS
jgi:O-antigen/teichoic acid export membrane protein